MNLYPLRRDLVPAPEPEAKWLDSTPESKSSFVATGPVQAAIENGTANFSTQLGTPLGALSRNQINEAYLLYENAGLGFLYQSVPAVRMCVDFLSRQIMQLNLELYSVNSDGEREDEDEHPAAELLSRPNPNTPGKHFIKAIVSEYLIYGNAYILKMRQGSALRLYQLPAWKVQPIGQSIFENERYKIIGERGAFEYVEPSEIIQIRDYNPQDMRRGISRLDTLRKVLQEDQVMTQTNLELMKSGLSGLGNSVIQRPADAPEWNEENMARFQEFMAAAMKKSSEVFPILGDGMTLATPNLSPQKAQMLESRKYGLETVAKVFGIPLGLLDGSEGDVEAQTSNLYQDVLPPLCDTVQGFLNAQLLDVEYPLDELCFEFDLKSKLRGDNQARLAQLVSVAGGPILTRNEARQMEGMAPVEDEGADELIVPLNVTEGGKPSPSVMPVQDPNGPAQDGSHRAPVPDPAPYEDPEPGKAANSRFELKSRELEGKARQLLARRKGQERRRDEYAGEYEALFSSHFGRQAASLQSKADDASGADAPRWNSELASDLLGLYRRQVNDEANIAATRLATGPFDMAQVKHYLEAKAENVAQNVNETTQAALGEPESIASDVFDTAKSDRAGQLGMTMASQLSAFSHTEAAKQDPNVSQRQKTWIVTSNNSRHPELDGESAPLYGEFSNGEQMPGDGGDINETAGCQCLVEVG